MEFPDYVSDPIAWAKAVENRLVENEILIQDLIRDKIWEWIDLDLDDDFFRTAGNIHGEEARMRLDEIPDVLLSSPWSRRTRRR